MRVYIDNTEIQASTSIADALDAAREHADNGGRLIIDILADGQAIDDELLENPPSDDAGIAELHLTTTDPVAFLTETFASARESLTLVREDQTTAADHLRTGELEPAVEALNGVLTGWQAVGDVVAQSAELADIDLNSFEFDGQQAKDVIEKLGDTLLEIRANLTHQDWSSLGDCLEYDLDDLAKQWDALLAALAQRVKAGV
ncbi:MAG: hypothetical protein ACX94C_01950 [Phycisphaerales bacterium]